MRPADFESKQAKVTLSFTVEDGSDPAPVVAKVFDMAVAEVHRRLGLLTQADKHEIGEAAAAAILPSMRKRAKAPPAEVEVKPAGEPVETVLGPPQGVKEGDPIVTKVHGVDVDPAAIGDPEAASEPVVYTDRQLRDAVVYAIGEKKIRNRAITDLIIEFTNPPGTPEGERVPGKNIPMIEQDRRGGFLDRLKALYADA
jgi:hypothetical protein